MIATTTKSSIRVKALRFINSLIVNWYDGCDIFLNSVKQTRIAITCSNSNMSFRIVGTLQSNKTKLVAEHASWVHSIDRLKIAQRLAEQRPAQLGKLKVLLQINISNEPTKAGILPQQLPELAAAVAQLPQLELKGLMAIPPRGIVKEPLPRCSSYLYNCNITTRRRLNYQWACRMTGHWL